MRTAHVWMIGLVLTGGCAEWPRFAHDVTSGDGDQVAGDVDPASLIAMTWTAGAEVEANDLPTDAQASRSSLSRGIGNEFSGALSTAGWDSGATPDAIVDDDCGAASGTRTAGVEPGDYLGDVDFFLVDPTEDGVLCARALVDVDTADRGWDLLAFPADACGIPGAVVTDDDGPVGYGLGGAFGGWAIPVTAGGRVAVLLSSYAPNAPDGEFTYRLGLSMVAAATSADVAPVCPLLGSEASAE